MRWGGLEFALCQACSERIGWPKSLDRSASSVQTRTFQLPPGVDSTTDVQWSMMFEARNESRVTNQKGNPLRADTTSESGQELYPDESLQIPWLSSLGVLATNTWVGDQGM